MDELNNQNMLQVGTILHGTYKIESYLSSGGFGNTYLAKNIEFDETYAIKEFFVKGVCQRDGNSTTISVSNAENTNSFEQQREKFKKEARRLRSLSNPHIVKVYDLFEENGTAYYVMDYVDGENLSARLKRTNAPLAESEVRNYLNQILDGLEAIHNEGMFHLDIKPANIMVDSHDVVKLIDFGASKQQSTVGGATMSTGISYTNGYAPSEQMAQSYDKFGPWTDFYALGATVYKLLTNQDPPSVSDLSEDETEDKHLALPMPNVSEEMKKLVVWMMQVNRLKRPKSVGEIRSFLHQLSATPTSNNEETKAYSPYQSYANPVSDDEETVLVSKAEKTKVEENKHSFSVDASRAAMGKGKKFLLSIFCFLILCSAVYLVYAKVQRDKVIANIVNNMVKINNAGYSINKYEVTQEEWEAVMGNVFYTPETTKAQLGILLSENKPGKEANPSYFKGSKLPVENVSWDECQKFIEKLNAKTGHHFRLPTWAEWSYAAKAGTNSEYAGSDYLDVVAWVDDNSGNKTHIVGTKTSNNFGLFDMCGNVMEWTQERHLCGGAYNSMDSECKISRPTYSSVKSRSCDSFIGLRLAE